MSTDFQRQAHRASHLTRWRRVIVCAAAVLTAQAAAQTEQDVHNILSGMARDVNEQMIGYRTDAATSIKVVTYSRSAKLFSYHYNLDAGWADEAMKLDQAELRQRMYADHRARLCQSNFAPVMRGFGLRVAHNFHHAATGKVLVRLEYQAKDCEGILPKN